MALPADDNKIIKSNTSSAPSQMDDSAISDNQQKDSVATPPPAAPKEPLGPPPTSPNQSVDGYGDGNKPLPSSDLPKEPEIEKAEVAPPPPMEIKKEPIIKNEINSPAPPPPSPLASSSPGDIETSVSGSSVSNSSLGPKPLGFAPQQAPGETPSAPPAPEIKETPKTPLSNKPAPIKMETKVVEPVKKNKKEKKPLEGKKSGGGKKIIMAVLGFFLLLGGLAAGYYYFNAQTPEVAYVGKPCLTNSQCNSANNEICVSGKCYKTASCSGGVYCAGCLKKCVTWEVLAKNGGTCNTMIQKKCGSVDVGDDTSSDEWVCDSQGCRLTDEWKNTEGCEVNRYACNRNTDLSGGCQDRKTGGPSNGLNFKENCGAEQIDVRCNGEDDFRSRIYSEPCGKKTPPPSSPPDTPTTSCIDLQRDMAEPKVGDEVTYVCEGSVSGGSDLSYEFRYSVNSGAFIPIGATANSATITVDQGGVWNVQCRACIDSGGQKICSTEWTGGT